MSTASSGARARCPAAPPPPGRRRPRAALAALAMAAAACRGGQAPTPAAPPAERRFTGATALKALAGGAGWLVLLETPKPQETVTVPARALVRLDERLQDARALPAVEGWILVDAAAHPSGDATALYVRFDFADPHPLRMQLSRWAPDGSRVDAEIAPETAADPSFIATLDRGRVVAAGEDVHVVARWPGNAVYAYRFGFGAEGFRQAWATRVEPEVGLGVFGIIGGGFDNFRQGENHHFAYLDVDEAGSAYVAVPSTALLLRAHDAAFGERLSDGADPGAAEYGAAILTKLDASGARVYARLVGSPGRWKSLLGMRAAGGVALLAGRVKTGGGADGWDAWLLSVDAETGAVRHDSSVDVQRGDAFWDATPAAGGRVVAVGCTDYTQNPSGVSVSDAREALAVILDAQGQLVMRLALPRGVEARGDEAVFVRLLADGRLAVAGMHDGPGTHAEVRSNGFLALQPVEELR